MTIRKVVGGYATMEVYNMVEDGGTFYWNDACISGLATEDSRKIVITTDGVETLARLYDGKKVVKSATAKCSSSDKFDFNTGAKIAFERLVGEEKPKNTESEKPHRKSKFEVGKYYKACGYLAGIIKITKIDEKSEERDGVLLDRMYYEVIEGMENDSPNKSFVNGSGFAFSLTPIDYAEKPEKPAEEEKKKQPSYYNGKVVCTMSSYRHWTVGKVYEFKDGVITDDDGDTRGKRSPYKSFDDFKKRFVDASPVFGDADFIPLVEEEK